MEGTPQPPVPKPPEPPKPPKPPPQAPKPAAPGTPGGRTGDPHERIDGLRSWLAQLERQVKLRTYIGAAAAVLAIAVAGVALYFALTTKDDAAKKTDVQALREQIAGVQASATKAAQADVQSLDQRLSDLEQQVSKSSNEAQTNKQELSVAQDDIDDLRSQISDLKSSGTTTP
jgi:polyhydroxyalkanoate synthesis regulator phasin